MHRSIERTSISRSCRRGIFLALFFLSPVLVSCGGSDGGDAGGNSATIQGIQGNAQKGPFVSGSSIQIFPLNASLVPTGSVFNSQISDDLGSFRMAASISAPFVEVVANGFYYDELVSTGSRLSSAQLTLRALAPASTTVDLRVNVLTTLVKGRLERLVSEGMSFPAASVQAKNELLTAFALPTSTLDDPTQVDVTRSGQGDAALIAISATLLQRAADLSASAADRTANLALTLSQLGTDFADGTLSAQNRKALALSARKLDAQQVRTNLQAILSGLGLSGSVPDIAPHVAPLAAQYPWQAGVPLPAARMNHGSCAVNGKIYVMGGAGNFTNGIGGTGDNVPNDQLREFDPATQAWTSRAAMPAARSGALRCDAVNGKLYVTGGSIAGSETPSVWEYDPAANSWASRQSAPNTQFGACSAVLNGKIYVLAGANNPTSSANEYDPGTNTWRLLAPFPIDNTYGVGCAAVNGVVYVIGGLVAGGAITATVHAYDPVANSWSVKAPMPTARSDVAVATVAGKVYAIGGFSTPPASADNAEYDPSTDTWVSKASLVFPVNGARAATVGGLVYVIGGAVSTPGATAVDRVEVYDPSKD